LISACTLCPVNGRSNECHAKNSIALCISVTTTFPYPKSDLSLHRLPEVVCVKVLRELRVNIDDMYVALFSIADGGLVVVTCLVLLESDAEGSIKPKSESAEATLASSPLFGPTRLT